MGLIKNYDQLGTSQGRKVVLSLIEAAFEAIQPREVFKNLFLEGHSLKVKNRSFDLLQFERIFILAFGKGSAGNALLLEKTLGEKLTGGFVIDVTEEKFEKLKFTLGTHPLPSQTNIDFTKKIIGDFNKLSEKDLVLVITCGGGSVLLEAPHNLSLEEMVEVNKALLHSGATIQEMNAVRKHLDIVKGGGLAQILFPAKVVNLIFSDVPGNDLSVIASGPLVLDNTTQSDAKAVISKYGLGEKIGRFTQNFVESPKDNKYFESIENILFLSNDTALLAMQEKAAKLGFKTDIFANNFQAEANQAGKKLIDAAQTGSILLAGGETDVKVTGKGTGGRNLQLVLAALEEINDDVVLAAFDSDGWDNCEAAGAIADVETKTKAKSAGLEPKMFLEENNSLPFFKAVGDAILTNRLPSNVSDLMVVFKP